MRILVDTNVLVRSVERRHPLMRPSRQASKILYQQGHELCATTQNIAEFWNVSTRPAAQNGLGNNIPALFAVLPDSMEAFREWRRLVLLHAVQGTKVHAARLVAIMKVHHIRQILTFNGGDFKRFPAIAILDPTRI